MQSKTQQAKSHPLIYPQVPSGDEDRVAEILGNIEKHVGFIPDGLRLYSISPPLLETFVGNVSYFNRGGTQLPPELTSMIRYLVSWKAGCNFCIDLNEGFLSSMGLSLDDIRAARNNPDAAPLQEKDKILLKMAIRAIENPDDISKADVQSARDAGWGDREIFDAIAQAASNRAFNYVLRTFKVEHQGAFI